MNISVVIPSLNSEKDIERCLSTLKPQLLEGDDIIIIDGASKDRTLEIAYKYGCQIFIYPEASLGEARNFGVSQSGNEIIIQTDTDVFFTSNFIDRLRKYFEENPELVGVSVGWRDGKGRALSNLTYMILEGFLKNADCIQCYTRKAFNKTQGHPNVSFGEQIGLWLQIERVGPTIYDPELFVYHYSDRASSITSYLIGGGLLATGLGYEGMIGGAVGSAMIGAGAGFLAGQGGVDILKNIPGVQEYWSNPRHLHHYHIGLMILAATMAFSDVLDDDLEVGLYGFGGALALHDLLTEPQTPSDSEP